MCDTLCENTAGYEALVRMPTHPCTDMNIRAEVLLVLVGIIEQQVALHEVIHAVVHISVMFSVITAWRGGNVPSRGHQNDSIIKSNILTSYTSPCPRRLPPWQPVGRRICRWPLWSSRCSHAPGWCVGGACGTGGPRWGWPLRQPSADFPGSWTSLDPAMVPHPWWRNLMGSYRAWTTCIPSGNRRLI